MGNAKPIMPKARATAADWNAYEKAYASWLLEERGALYVFDEGGATATVYTELDGYFNRDEAEPFVGDPKVSGGATTAADPAKKAREAEARAFVRSYTGTFGLILDIQARIRRDGDRYTRLSERQVEVILNSKARDEARAIGSEIAAADAYANWVAARATATVTFSDGPVAATAPVVEGMYKLADGTIVKVQRAVNGSGHLYAKRLVVRGAGEAKFEYEAGLIRRLTADMRLAQDEAAEFGKLYGVCCVCGRTLTDERSIADGIGPVCAGREWGSAA